jgi:hypothetical protein
VAFVAAGFVPLVAYTIPPPPLDRFASSILLTMLALFTVGALRSMISNAKWWWAGLEMFALGAIVATRRVCERLGRRVSRRPMVNADADPILPTISNLREHSGAR